LHIRNVRNADEGNIRLANCWQTALVMYEDFNAKNETAEKWIFPLGHDSAHPADPLSYLK
jgi:hypothetical protein